MTAQLDIQNKRFVEGDDITITWTFKNKDGSLYDFSDVTKAWFTIKEAFSDPDAEAIVGPLNSVDQADQVTYGVAGPGEGKLKVWMKAGDTPGLADYQHRYYDIQVLKAGLIHTLVRGEIGFVHEVTLAIS